MKIGLASSSSRQWIDMYVDRLGIRHYFDCFCSADTVTNVKPDPELYLQALEQLGVEADEAMAIEDSPNGAQAAVAARTLYSGYSERDYQAITIQYKTPYRFCIRTIYNT